MSLSQTAGAKAQLASAGGSSGEIQRAAVELADPRPGLTWLDVGCGTGQVLRTIRDLHSPASLAGVDVLDWLAEDLRPAVAMTVGRAEQAALGPADRVMMVEAIEHLDAPWSVLRNAAAAVKPGGAIVVTTPSVTNLRHRLELSLRGRLTSFRPDNVPHLGPALPHVIERLLGERGMKTSVSYCGRDVVPGTGGRHWPRRAQTALPELTSVSVAIVGRAPAESA
jgi:SAM-dependent methyltransferase